MMYASRGIKFICCRGCFHATGKAQLARLWPEAALDACFILMCYMKFS